MSLKKNFAWSLLVSVFLAAPLLADTVNLQSGASYTGSFENAKGNGITFTDNQGVAYTFPLSDVQSRVFTGSTDIVTLRSGKVYSGQYTGGDTISFTDNQGVGYIFPVRDVALLGGIFGGGKVVKVPAETLLRFRLYRTLVLRPGS